MTQFGLDLHDIFVIKS